MSKLVTMASLLILAPVSFAQGRFSYHRVSALGFDLRASYIATATVDGFQTAKFPRLGIQEANPFVSPFVTARRVGNGTFAAFSIVAVGSIDWVIQQLPKQDQAFWYGLALVAHSFTVTHNRRFGLRGFPIWLPSAWTRPLERRSQAPVVSFVL